MDATTMRASTVSRSMPTSETRTQASMTMPLSRTRSRTSMRLVPPEARSTGMLITPWFLSSGRRAVFAPPLPACLGCGSQRGDLLLQQADLLPQHLVLEGQCRRAPTERLGSWRHQSSPICSALSIEQTSSRMRMVSSSTSARETRMSPAMTRPLSRTRSRTSTRPWTGGRVCRSPLSLDIHRRHRVRAARPSFQPLLDSPDAAPLYQTW